MDNTQRWEITFVSSSPMSVWREDMWSGRQKERDREIKTE